MLLLREACLDGGDVKRDWVAFWGEFVIGSVNLSVMLMDFKEDVQRFLLVN